MLNFKKLKNKKFYFQKFNKFSILKIDILQFEKLLKILRVRIIAKR